MEVQAANMFGYRYVSKHGSNLQSELEEKVNVSQALSTLMPHPSLERWCLKKSLAANLIAFSGVTSVRFTAAPRRIKTTESHEEKLCVSEFKVKVFDIPLYIPKYPSDRMVLIRQSDLKENNSNRGHVLLGKLQDNTDQFWIWQNCKLQFKARASIQYMLV